MTWWSSIEQLTRASAFTQWLVIVLSLLAAVCGTAKVVISNRLDVLKAKGSRELSMRLSEAQEKLLQLESEQQPRRLTAVQHTMLVSELSKYHGQPVQIVLNPMDLEGRKFAADFDRCLTAAGWNLTEPGLSDYHPRAGIYVWHDPHSASQAAANRLIVILSRFGYAVNTSEDLAQMPHDPRVKSLIVVSVGRKKD